MEGINGCFKRVCAHTNKSGTAEATLSSLDLGDESVFILRIQKTDYCREAGGFLYEIGFFYAWLSGF